MDNKEAAISENEIIKNMVGREITNIYPPRGNKKIGDIRFELKNWTVYDMAAQRGILNDININVRQGEIVGIAGLMGAGRTELALSLFGNTAGYKLLRGELCVDGKKLRFRHPRNAIDDGVAYVTEDRKKNGLVLIQDIKYNISIAGIEKLIHHLVVDENEEIVVANHYKDSINIKAPSIRQIVQTLSGGNQQKVALAKWMYTDPKVLILDEPTRGIDVGAKYEIYTLMNRLVEQGMSIIMISSELLEVLGMSDRIYTMNEGSITGELMAEDATEEKVMRLATKTNQEMVI
jgi:putative multiple sugar transport system ATP-binding protein